jgi:hypothetical protein
VTIDVASAVLINVSWSRIIAWCHATDESQGIDRNAECSDAVPIITISDNPVITVIDRALG